MISCTGTSVVNIENLLCLAAVACELMADQQNHRLAAVICEFNHQLHHHRHRHRHQRRLHDHRHHPNKFFPPESRVQRLSHKVLALMDETPVTEKVIRTALGNTPDTSKALRLLLNQKKIKRIGHGGRASPFQYAIVVLKLRSFSLRKGVIRADKTRPHKAKDARKVRVSELEQSEQQQESLRQEISSDRNCRSNIHAYVSLLKQHGNAKCLSSANKLHAFIIHHGLDRSTYLGNLIVQMYGKCGSIKDARLAFEKIERKNVYTWTIMISAYAQAGHHGEEALALFRQMEREGVKPNPVTFATVVSLCANMESIEEGRLIHARILRLSEMNEDIAIGNALINMYSKCKCLSDAEMVFKEMRVKDVISWTSMIKAYSEHRWWTEAVKVFWQMQSMGVEANEITCLSVLGACAGLGALEEGRAIHKHINQLRVDCSGIVGNSLVHMYGKCGNWEDARNVFDRMRRKSAVTYTSMIAAYTECGQGKLAVDVYKKMMQSLVKTDNVVHVMALDACASVGALEEGKAIHATVIENMMESDILICTSLLNMYGKCGSLELAKRVFDRMTFRNSVTWNSMIASYTQHGHMLMALSSFVDMVHDGVYPNDITFISILFACSHRGLVKEARRHFLSIEKDYDVNITVDHYTCIIDVLGRSGWLDVAEELIENMPFQPQYVSWSTLLGACRIHKDSDRAQRLAEELLTLDPYNSSPLVMLSNVYAAVGKWDDVSRIERLLKERSCMVSSSK